MFRLEPAQYVSALKSISKDTIQGSGLPSIFPVHCGVPDSPRYKNGKPNPQPSSIVSVEGWVVAVRQKKGENTAKQIDFFEVRVEQVRFLGKANVPATSSIGNSSKFLPSNFWFVVFTE